MATPTEGQILKMKKDQLKEVILSNGYGALYKASFLKADLQVLALKSVGLAEDKPMPAAVASGRTPKTARKTYSLSSPAKQAPATAPAKTTTTPLKTPDFDIDPISFPLPETPDDGAKEEVEETEEPAAADKGSMDSKMWAMVDGAFIVMLVVIVVSVFVAYALSDPTIKGEVVSQWVSFKTIMLDRLAEAKEQMQFGDVPEPATPEAY